MFDWQDIAFGFAIYFIIWWVTLFAVLPFGVRTQDDEKDITLGTTSSAPAKVKLRKIFLLNTLVSLIVFALFCFVTIYLDLGLDDLPQIAPSFD